MKLTYFSLHRYKSRIFSCLRKEKVILVLAHSVLLSDLL